MAWRRPLPPAIPLHGTELLIGSDFVGPPATKLWTPEEQIAILSKLDALEKVWQEEAKKRGFDVSFGSIDWYPFGKPEEAQ